MRLILIGAPGSGKGTQAQLLTKRFDIPQISTGDIFRKNIKEGTPLGLKVKDIIARGELVPDEVVIEIVNDRLNEDDCKNGFIMDGFPRSIPQAEAFDKLQQVDAVINLVIDNEIIIHRMTGRRTCTKCGAVFHSDAIGNTDLCGACGGKLYIRDDDKKETVVNRLSVYEQTTKPLVEYYSKFGRVINVDSNQPVDKVLGDIVEGLNK